MKTSRYIITGIIHIFTCSMSAQQSLQHHPIFNPAPAPSAGTSRDFLPVSPEAGSLGIFGQIPVGNYTGTAEISIPLYTIKYKELSVPISLNYHTSGNKPDIFPGAVGLGWALQSGGIISRVVNGNPDFGMAPPSQGTSLLLVDYRAADDWADLNKLNEYIQHNTLGFVNTNDPDEFYFNINGNTGKFYIDHTDTFRVQSIQGESYSIVMNKVSHSTVSFLKLFQGRAPDSSTLPQYYNNIVQVHSLISGFTMVDTHGIKYTFGGNELSIEFTRPGFNEYTVIDGSEIRPMSWFLTSIESPNGYKIDFKYAQQTIISKTRFSDVALVRYNNSTTMQRCIAANYEDAIKSNMINGCYLTEIKFPNGKIAINNSMACEQLDYTYDSSYGGIKINGPFNRFQYYDDVCFANTEKIVDARYDPDPESVRNRFFPYKIDKILLYDNQNNIIRQFGFEYTNRRNTRLKLKSLSIIGNDETKQIYKFEYDSQSLPPYLAGKTDHYGFYNGTPIFDQITPGSYTTFIMNNRDYLKHIKNFNADHTAAEILKKIIYPTKGYTLFEYEQHDFRISYHTWPFQVEQGERNEQTGGLRIKTVKNFDYSDKLLTEKRYHYIKDYLNGGEKSSGVLAYFPEYIENYKDKYVIYAGQSAYRLGEFFRFSTNPVYPMIETRGNHITYSEVTEEDVNNGYTVYKYKNYDNGYLDREVINHTANILSDNTNGTGNIVEFRKEDEGISLELERGQILSETYYDKYKNALKQILFTYNDDENRFKENVRYLHYTPNSFNLTGNRSYRLSAGVYYTYYPYLKERTETDFLNGNISTRQTFTYDKKYRLIKTESIQSSQKQNICVEYTYPFNNPSSNPVNEEMVNSRMLAYPLEQTLTLSGKPLSNTICSYSDNLAVNAPSLLFLKQKTVQYANNAPQIEADYLKYDSSGNPLSIKDKNNVHNCILWSYGGEHPVAFIEGIAYEEVLNRMGENFINNLRENKFPTRTTIESIRNFFADKPNVLVSTYTYQPLLGVTSNTDQRQVTTYYEYDPLGRLSCIKDNNNKIIRQYDYHYKE